jgi:hypothetical protein
MTSSTSKKRKRDDITDNEGISFRLSNQPASQLGPVLGEDRNRGVFGHGEQVLRNSILSFSQSPFPLLSRQNLYHFDVIRERNGKLTFSKKKGGRTSRNRTFYSLAKPNLSSSFHLTKRGGLAQGAGEYAKVFFV